MRTETEEIRDNLKYLSLLARDYPSQAAAASEIISTQALLKLPKGTEHFMSDLHGENELPYMQIFSGFDSTRNVFLGLLHSFIQRCSLCQECSNCG